MIDKTIHYCWFGGNEKPTIIKKCIKSWSKICPDYKIIEWNETNFDINISDYVREAYEHKKFAFVSDYARFYILNKYGGIYLDTDVELIKDITPLLNNNFAGFEADDSVATGLIMACDKNNALCQAMIDEYNNDKFLNDDGSINLKTVCERTTGYLVNKGLMLDGKTQKVDDYIIYSAEYFNPTDMQTGKVNITKNTYSIHKYAASWVNKKDRIRGKIYQFISRLFGVKTADKIRRLVGRKK